MAESLAPSSRQAASLTTGVLLGAGIVLYQMTSLVLAPGSNHQIPLSLRTGGHEPALIVPPGAGMAHDAEPPVSYSRATVERAARPMAHPRSGSSAANRPAPQVSPAALVVTPVESSNAPADGDRSHHRSGDRTAGQGKSD